MHLEGKGMDIFRKISAQDASLQPAKVLFTLDTRGWLIICMQHNIIPPRCLHSANQRNNILAPRSLGLAGWNNNINLT